MTWEGRSEVKRLFEKNGNIGVVVCIWEAYSREERFSFWKREEAEMISSERFLVWLETWNPDHKWKYWREDISRCYKKEDGKDGGRYIPHTERLSCFPDDSS